MDEGVTLLDPDTVYFSHDTIFGTDVIVVQRRSPGVEVENNVEICPATSKGPRYRRAR